MAVSLTLWSLHTVRAILFLGRSWRFLFRALNVPFFRVFLFCSCVCTGEREHGATAVRRLWKSSLTCYFFLPSLHRFEANKFIRCLPSPVLAALSLRKPIFNFIISSLYAFACLFFPRLRFMFPFGCSAVHRFDRSFSVWVFVCCGLLGALSSAAIWKKKEDTFNWFQWVYI